MLNRPVLLQTCSTLSSAPPSAESTGVCYYTYCKIVEIGSPYAALATLHLMSSYLALTNVRLRGCTTMPNTMDTPSDPEVWPSGELLVFPSGQLHLPQHPKTGTDSSLSPFPGMETWKTQSLCLHAEQHTVSITPRRWPHF